MAFRLIKSLNLSLLYSKVLMFSPKGQIPVSSTVSRIAHTLDELILIIVFEIRKKLNLQ